jgi:hypothetical protein
MITRSDILMGRDRKYPLSEALEDNLDILLNRLNHFEKEYYNFSGRIIELKSGYRPEPYNMAAGGSKNSAHLFCQAVDLKDANNAIKLWVMSYPRILEICDLYMEHPDYTSTWCHLSTREVSKRIFIPY